MPIQQKNNKETMSFEAAFKELGGIVSAFEKSELDLEKGLELFRRAITLAEVCKQRLDEVENKVVAIKKQFSDFSR